MTIRWFALCNSNCKYVLKASWFCLSPSTQNFNKRHRNISAEKGLVVCSDPVQQHSPFHVCVHLYSLIFISEGHLPLGTRVCLFREMDLMGKDFTVFSIDTSMNKSSFLPLN